MTAYNRLPAAAQQIIPRRLLATTIASGSIFLGTQVPQASAQENLVLEEVIVTARLRQESLQDIPVSVSAFDASEIAKRNVPTLRDLAAAAPNVVFTGPRNSAVPSFSVRGVKNQSRSNIGFESGIGVYIDGVIMGRPIGFNQPLFDVERVEFLRGPQGTLFGKNSISGAVSITTKTPGDEFTGDVALEIGENNLVRVEGYVSGPLIENVLAGSVAISSRTSEGYIENVFTGNDVDDQDEQSIRAKLHYTPSDALAITLSGDFLDDDAVSASGQAISGYGAVEGQYKTNVSLESLAAREIMGTTLTVNYDLGNDMALTSISSYREMERDGTADTDAGPLQVVDSFAHREQEQMSQELRIAKAGPGKLSYVAGLYYFNQDIDSEAISCFGPFPPPFDFLSGLCGNTFGSIETTSYAAFANADYQLSDALTLTAGLRWTREEKELGYEQIGFPFLAPNLPFETDDLDDDDVSPTLSLRWDLSDNSMVYATASRGFKSGGWNVDNVATNLITSFSQLVFDSESVWNYELGFKTTLAENRVRLNGSVFFMDYEDLQVSKLVEVLGGGGAQVGITTNAGTAEVTGFELEMQWLVSSNLDINAGIGYTEAEYVEYTDTGPAGEISFEGNKLDRAPDWTGNISAEYSIPMDKIEFVARADYLYRDSFFTERQNLDAFAVDSVSLLNAKVGVRSMDGRWEAYVFAQNALDKDYIVQRGLGGFVFTGPSENVSWGQPRTVSLRVDYHF